MYPRGAGGDSRLAPGAVRLAGPGAAHVRRGDARREIIACL